jgi:hypothetical protein
VLVVAPNLTIKRQLADAMDISSAECFLRKAGVLTNLSRGPYRRRSTPTPTYAGPAHWHNGCDEWPGWQPFANLRERESPAGGKLAVLAECRRSGLVARVTVRKTGTRMPDS